MQVVKEKTVDGIFGTSGGIGLTKANELFVGRVAMFGFAVHFRLSLSLSQTLSSVQRKIVPRAVCLFLDKRKQLPFARKGYPSPV
jgi:hypothetical protein